MLRLGLQQLEPDRPTAPQRSILSRVSTAHFLMVLFGLLGFGLTLFLLQQNEATVAIAVATDDMAAGTSLDAGTFGVVDVPADGPLASTAIRPTGITDDLSVSAPIEAGAPILESLVVDESPLDQLNSLSIPIDEERALGGEFAAGDRVHLIGVVDVGSGADATAISTFVAANVPVLGDREEPDRAFGGSTSEYFVAVGLDPQQSLSATTAMMVGRLEVVRAGDAPVDMADAAVSTSGGVAIVDRADVAGYLQAAVEAAEAGR
jgi:Flp pilus assembly protein CpaB